MLLFYVVSSVIPITMTLTGNDFKFLFLSESRIMWWLFFYVKDFISCKFYIILNISTWKFSFFYFDIYISHICKSDNPNRCFIPNHLIKFHYTNDITYLVWILFVQSGIVVLHMEQISHLMYGVGLDFPLGYFPKLKALRLLVLPCLQEYLLGIQLLIWGHQHRTLMDFHCLLEHK